MNDSSLGWVSITCTEIKQGARQGEINYSHFAMCTSKNRRGGERHHPSNPAFKGYMQHPRQRDKWKIIWMLANEDITPGAKDSFSPHFMSCRSTYCWWHQQMPSIAAKMSFEVGAKKSLAGCTKMGYGCPIPKYGTSSASSSWSSEGGKEVVPINSDANQ